MTIWKFPLEIVGQQSIRCPSSPKFLSVQFQHGRLCLWALVEPDNEMMDHDVHIFGTGHPVSGFAQDFIGTVQQEGGALVWHVFAR